MKTQVTIDNDELYDIIVAHLEQHNCKVIRQDSNVPAISIQHTPADYQGPANTKVTVDVELTKQAGTLHFPTGVRGTNVLPSDVIGGPRNLNIP